MKHLASVGFLGLSLSELSPEHLKGIDILVDHPGANPVLGYISLKSFLPNRRFLGHYGPKARGIFCTKPDDSIMGGNLFSRQDCPQDRNAEWLQRLFPSQDGSNFVANHLKSDHVSRLTPGVIGQILERVAVGNTDWDTLVHDLTRILYSSLNPIGFAISEVAKLRQIAPDTRGLISWIIGNRDRLPRWIIETHLSSICAWGLKKESKDPLVKRFVRRLPSRIPDFCKLAMGALDDASLFDLYTEIHDLAPLERPPWDLSELQSPTDFRNHIIDKLPSWLKGLMRTSGLVRPSCRADGDELTDLLQAYDALTIEDRMNGERNTFYGTYSDFREIAELFVDAIKESRGASEVEDGFSYPPYFPEQTLIAYMIRRIDNKRDLLPFLLAMPALVRDKKFLVSKALQQAFVEDTWQNNPTGASPVETLVHSYVTGVMMTRVLPPQVPQGRAFHTLSDMQVGYSDCGETSLRNFFNSMLFNSETKRFDVSILERLETGNPALKIQLFGPLREFYLENDNPAASVAERLRHKWAYEVVGRHEGIIYNRRWETAEGRSMTEEPLQFDLASAGGSENMFKLLGILLFAPEDRSTWQALPRKSQISTICNLFSRPGFALECIWKTNARRTGRRMQILETITFRVNGGLEAFDWEFYDGHFAIVVRNREGSVPQVTDIIPAAAPLYFSGMTELPLDIVSTFNENPALGMNIILSGNYAGTQARFDFLVQILWKDLDDEVEEFFRNMMPIAKRVTDMLLGLGDYSVQSAVEDRLIRAGFPFGIPSVFNYQDSGFLRLEDSEFLKKVPPALAHLGIRERFRQFFPNHRMRYLSIKWETKLMGQTVIILETPALGDDVHWETAMVGCFALNGGADEVLRVRRQFELREQELQKIRGQSPVSQITQEIEAVYQRFPLNGVSLLGFEQHLAMQEKKTKILPKPAAYYWSGMRDISVTIASSYMEPFKIDTGKRHAARCAYSGSHS
jgi:hypothetical protein